MFRVQESPARSTEISWKTNAGRKAILVVSVLPDLHFCYTYLITIVPTMQYSLNNSGEYQNLCRKVQDNPCGCDLVFSMFIPSFI